MLFAIAVIVLLILDQALKYWVTLNIALGEGVRGFIPGVLELRNIHNTGAAFSMLSNASRWVFVALAVVVTVVIIVAVRKQWVRGHFGRWMAILMLAGVLGNCLDRLLSGYVVDMFQFVFWPSFPVFNIADICLVIGAIGFCLHLFFYREKPEMEREEDAAPAPQEKSEQPEAVKPEPPVQSVRVEPVGPALDEQPTKKVPVNKPKKPLPKAAEDDPFATWQDEIDSLEAKRQAQAKAEAEAKAKAEAEAAKAKEEAEAQAKAEAKPDTKAKRKPKEAPKAEPTAAPAQSEPEDFNFSLDDILKEYSDHK